MFARNDSQAALAERITTLAGLTALAVGSWMVRDPARSQRGAARRMTAALAVLHAGTALRLGGD